MDCSDPGRRGRRGGHCGGDGGRRHPVELLVDPPNVIADLRRQRRVAVDRALQHVQLLQRQRCGIVRVLGRVEAAGYTTPSLPSSSTPCYCAHARRTSR
eukprot:356975-Chlamydomonas_euryale.AAC.2